MSFAAVLFFIFLTLKLTGYIVWPWLWVFSPLWIGVLVFVILLMMEAASLPEHTDY